MKWFLLICILLVFPIFSVNKDDLFKLCEGKLPGNECSIDKNGNFIAGICHTKKEGTLCIPLNMDKLPVKRNLPSEAFESCLKKKLATNCEIKKFFMSFPGKCHTYQGKLMCRPLKLPE